MSHPWMPLYVAAYLADTAHLDATESGAYLHLIMHYWQCRGLPDDPRKLAQIAKVSAHKWKKICSTMQQFFHDGWKHSRIDDELRKADDISVKRSSAAKGKRPKPQAKAEQKHTHLHLPLQIPGERKEEGGGGEYAHAREAASAKRPLVTDEARILAEAIAAAAGHENPKHWPPGWCGAPMRVQAMLDQHWRGDLMLATARGVMANKRDGPADSLVYFERAFARAHAKQSAPLPVVVTQSPQQTVLDGSYETARTNRKNGSGITAAIDSHVARFEREASRDLEIREAAPGMLPDGRRQRS